MSRAKIIVLTHEFSPFRGGASIYAQELAEGISRISHEVELWAPDYHGRSGADGGPVRVLRLPAGGSLRPFDMMEYMRALSVRFPLLRDATVIPVSVGAHMALMILSQVRGARFGEMISVLHGSEALRFRRNPFCRFLARQFFRTRVDRIATVSEFSKSLIVQSQLVPAERSILIAPGACSSAARRETASEVLRSAKLKILTLARIDPRKGQLDVARALALLPAEMRGKILYQVAGRSNGIYLHEIEQACADGNVPFVNLGEVAPNEVAVTYRQCDIYAMTSRVLPRSVEGFGLTYLEAGFHGKPVVAYRSGGATEAVIDNETGLLVSEGNVSALADAFARLITEPELRERLGEGGKRNNARYSWEKTARILLDS